MSLYNEIDPYAAQWIANLVTAGHVAPGAVDVRSIKELSPSDVQRQSHFFAGIGVWSHALREAGYQDDFPIWTGSCPCQPFSASGRRSGVADPRHLWPDWFRLIRECRPACVVGEQVASPDGLAWLDDVLADLEGAGYAAAAFDLGAAGVGAPHVRQRIYFAAIRLGDANGSRGQARLPEPEERQARNAGVADDRSSEQFGPGGRPQAGFWNSADWLPCRDGKLRPVEPGTFPLAHGLTGRVGRLRAYGNAIVGPLATIFLEALKPELTHLFAEYEVHP